MSSADVGALFRVVAGPDRVAAYRVVLHLLRVLYKLCHPPAAVLFVVPVVTAAHAMRGRKACLTCSSEVHRLR